MGAPAARLGDSTGNWGALKQVQTRSGNRYRRVAKWRCTATAVNGAYLGARRNRATSRAASTRQRAWQRKTIKAQRVLEARPWATRCGATVLSRMRTGKGHRTMWVDNVAPLAATQTAGPYTPAGLHCSLRPCRSAASPAKPSPAKPSPPHTFVASPRHVQSQSTARANHNQMHSRAQPARMGNEVGSTHLVPDVNMTTATSSGCTAAARHATALEHLPSR